MRDLFILPSSCPYTEREFAARYEAGLQQTLPYLASGAVLLVLLFGLWDYWIDPAGARLSVPVRLACAALAALAIWPDLLRWSASRRASFIHWTCSAAVLFATFTLDGALTFGLPGLVVGPFLVSLVVPRVSVFIFVVGLPYLAFAALAWQLGTTLEFFNGLVFHTLAVVVALMVLLHVRFLRWREFLLERSLTEIAHHDPLTGLVNRGQLTVLGERELARAMRHRRPLAIALLDVDHFKHVNDTYGHDGGDLVLKALAQQCLSDVRAVDHVGRLGGEEFVCILPDTAPEDAALCAERLRRNVEAMEIVTPGGVVHITISIGIANYREGCPGWEALIKEADMAMYAAKHQGRNRVVAAPLAPMPATEAA